MRILWSSCRAPHAGLPSSCLRACVRRATRHSLRLTRARPAGPTRRWARTKGCAEPPSRPSPAHLPRSAREATVSGRAHLAGPAAAPPSDVGGGRGRRGGGSGGQHAHAHCAVGRGGGRVVAPSVAAADAPPRRPSRLQLRAARRVVRQPRDQAGLLMPTLCRRARWRQRASRRPPRSAAAAAAGRAAPRVVAPPRRAARDAAAPRAALHAVGRCP